MSDLTAGDLIGWSVASALIAFSVGTFLGASLSGDRRPPIEVTTAPVATPLTQSLIDQMKASIDLRPYALRAGADPDGNAAMIHLDVKGRVIAKCDLEP